MKRLFISFFILVSFVSLAQTEVWGIKYRAGEYNGGVLFSIDSTSYTIENRYSFGGPHPDHEKAQMIYLNDYNKWYGVIADILFSYDPETSEMEYRGISPFISGSLIYAENGLIYAIGSPDRYANVFEINPADLSWNYTHLDPNYKYSYSTGFTQYNSNELVFQRGLDICKYNISGDSISIEHSFGFYGNKGYGSFIPLGQKYYGFTNSKIDDSNYLIIYSYNFDEDEYIEEYNLYNGDAYLSSWLGDFVLNENGNFYGTFFNDDINLWQLFSFNPSNNAFEILEEFEEDDNPYGKLISIGDKIYGVSHKEYGFLGRLFSYDIGSDEIAFIHEFSDEDHVINIGNLSIENDQSILGYFETNSGEFRYHIFNYSLINNSFQIVKSFNPEPNQMDGYYPEKVIQLSDGKLIGNARGGNTNNGILFEFDPITNEYSVLKDIAEIDISSSLRDFCNMSEDHIFMHLYDYSTGDFDHFFYLYDYHNDVIQLLDSIDPNPFNEIGWIIESDSTVLLYHSFQLERFYPFTNHREIISDLEGNIEYGDVDNLQLLNENKLIYLYTESNNLAQVKTFDINTHEYEIVFDVREYLSYPENNSAFDFALFDNNKLVGSIKYIQGEGKLAYWIKQLVEFDIDTQEVIELNGPYYNSYYGQEYCFINDYDNDGGYFCLKPSLQYEYDGTLDLANFQDQTYDVLDYFIPYSWEYFEDEVYDYVYLTKFNSVENSVDIPEHEKDYQIKVFCQNKILNIHSQQLIQNADVIIFDMSGRQVYEFVAQNFTQASRQLKLSPGSYIVRISSEEYQESHKIIVN